MLSADFQVPSESLVQRYDTGVAPFASYPKAPPLSAEVGDCEFLDALIDSNERLIPSPLMLYAHLPFCQTLCYSCSCNKMVTRNRALMDRYIKVLQREIRLKARYVDNDREIRSLHWGGGTPGYLTYAQLRTLMGVFSDEFPLASHTSRDFSIDIDPRSVDIDDLDAIRSLGFNRVVFGVTDTDPDVQRGINRPCALETVQSLVSRARRAGFRSIALRLVQGLPHQTADSFSRTLERMIELRPDAFRISSYQHQPVVHAAQRLLDDQALPSPSVRTAIFRESAERLIASGYEHIGIGHFASRMSDIARAKREGNLQRSLHGYVTGRDGETLGFGSSAISQIGDGLFQNDASLSNYLARIENHGFAIARGYAMTEQDRQVAEVTQSILCTGGCSKAAWSERNGVAFDRFFEHARHRLQPLVDDGLIIDTDDDLQISPIGSSFLGAVVACFDSEIGLGEPRLQPRFEVL